MKVITHSTWVRKMESMEVEGGEYCFSDGTIFNSLTFTTMFMFQILKNRKYKYVRGEH